MRTTADRDHAKAEDENIHNHKETKEKSFHLLNVLSPMHHLAVIYSWVICTLGVNNQPAKSRLIS